MLLCQLGDQERFLGLPDQPGRGFIDRRFVSAHDVGRNVRLARVQAHDVSLGLMQAYANEVHFHHAWEAVGELSKQRVEITMGGNGFRYFQQRLMPLHEEIGVRSGEFVCHVGTRGYPETANQGSGNFGQYSTWWRQGLSWSYLWLNHGVIALYLIQCAWLAGLGEGIR